MKIRLCLLLFVFAFLSACQTLEPVGTIESNEGTKEYVYTSVQRFIDKEAGVVCYLYSSIQKGGISCLPLSDTLLGE